MDKSEKYYLPYNFVFTNDNTTGLYNYEVGDIYHSSYGAKSEAQEKFIKPLNFESFLKNKKSIKVLDICYGIGYNTKAFLKKIIDTNYKGSVEIDALEYDKNLVTLSPFIVDGYFNNYADISYSLLSALYDDIVSNGDMIELYLEKYKKHITPFYRQLIKKKHFSTYINNPLVKNNSFLHNIYYHCVSSRIKNSKKRLNFNKIKFNAYYNDARESILQLNKAYDVIFLDAFTPAKLPTLWSIQFFQELYTRSCDDGVLVTYSNSAAIRHAMLKCGFYVGKIFDIHNRACGTIASKSKCRISHPLDEYDLGLINTNAGVYYCDTNLNLSSDEILKEHEIRKQSLNLQSSSQYIKQHKKGAFNE